MLASLVFAMLASAPVRAARPPAVPPEPVATPAPPAPECPAWGEKPPGCVEPPLKDSIRFFWDWSEAYGDELIASGAIRGPKALHDYRTAIPLDQFPTLLRRGEDETSGWIALRLVIGRDDTISECRVLEVKALQRQGKNPSLPIDLGPGFGESGCGLARRYGKFRHAIDSFGQPLAAPILVRIDYQRQRREPMVAPAPAPPTRWIGKRPYGSSAGWPPRHRFPPSFVLFAPPRWQDFVKDRKDLPKAATVGVLLDFAKGGDFTGCKIGLSSGDTALDEATCLALAGSHNVVPVYGPVREYAIEVRWQKKKAKLAFPVKPVPPALLAPIAIAEADLPAGALPGDAIQLQIQVDPAGKALSCQINSSWKASDAFEAQSCALAVKHGSFSGGVDQFGRGAVGGLYLSVDWNKRSIIATPGYF